VLWQPYTAPMNNS